MSSRAMRRLRKDRDLILIPELENKNVNRDESGSSDDEPDFRGSVLPRNNRKKGRGKAPKINPFDVLNDADEDVNAQQSDPNEKENDEESQSEYVGTGAKKKKKKNKKKKKINLDNEKDNKEVEEDLEAAIQEVKDKFGDTEDLTETYQDPKMETAEFRSLLNVEHRNLNSDTEMKRIFGSRVVGSENSRRTSRNRNRVYHRTTWLTQTKDTWPVMGKIGLSMEKRESGSGGRYYFAFTHSNIYQQVQFKFLDAVESLNPENIVAILSLQAYHIDSLVQLSEVCRLSDDNQMATELIERALYAYECAFHPLFNLAQGNSRLDYRIQENRGFFLVLFRHLITIGNKGCYRTALEFCKLLLSLDPISDPLCVLLMMDFYALRSDQYSYLVRVYNEWEARRNLSQLPNFAFSYPLALFHLSTRGEADLNRANDMLQSALLMFPMVLLPLLEKCAVVPDTEVEKHHLFAIHNQFNVPDALRMLCGLYVERAYSCWKPPEVVEWLEQNVRRVLQRANTETSLVNDNADKRIVRYKGCPQNIYRHLIISDLKGAKVTLPPHLSRTSILSYDPLPPVDSMTAYTRPDRPPRYNDDASVLSMFFRSLMPNFDLQTPQEAAAGNQPIADANDDNEASNATTNDLRQNVGALMAAMRDLLSNIQPVPPPIENGGENENQEDDQQWDL